MKRYIYEVSARLGIQFEEIFSGDNGKLLPSMDNSYPATLLFYAFAHDYGDDVIGFESETVEIILANEGHDYKTVEKINNMISLVNRMDDVLSTHDDFLYACVILNDLGDVSQFMDSVSAEHMVWAIIILMAIYGASNIPIVGDAVRVVVATLQDEGWTTPPVFLSSPKIMDLMFYADKNLPTMVDKHKDRFFYINNPDSKVNIENQYDNYFEMHKDMLYYLQQEDTSIEIKIGELI